ncbi:MAG: hypothetical protein AAF569_03265 [Pseudomonadota bacterium]
MRILLLTALIFLLPSGLQAQDILDAPICTQIVNEADYTVRGSIATARSTYTDPNDSTRDGTQARHSANFMLKPGERWDVCSSGPFYEGQRLELTLRTLIPVFECQTALIAPIVIRSHRDENGTLKTWAECF